MKHEGLTVKFKSTCESQGDFFLRILTSYIQAVRPNNTCPHKQLPLATEIQREAQRVSALPAFLSPRETPAKGPEGG